MFFVDITRFHKAADFLPLVTSAILVDLVVIWMLIAGAFRSKTLTEWYHIYGLGAVLSDVLSIVIGVMLAIIIYPFLFSQFNMLWFLGVAVGVQLVHDMLFFLFFRSIARGQSRILDTFKDYANEMGPIILATDATMIVSAALLTSLLASLGEKWNTLLAMIAAYMVPYFLWSIPNK
jgi:hypothetical protein